MYRICSALIESVAAAVFIIPIWCIYNKLCFHSWKRTIIYMVFGFYFSAVLALVGFPNIASLKIDFAVNVIPFLDMVSDFINACLNILLFVPFGFFLPILWDKFRNIKNIALMGFIVTSLYQKTWKEINTEIAERMVQLRKRKKLSQKSLALRSGVSLGSLKRFEQTGEISLQSLTKIAIALEVEGELEELFSKVPFASIEEVIHAQTK